MAAGLSVRPSAIATMRAWPGALGAHGERVTVAEELEGAIARALENAPAVVDVVTTREAVSSDSRKGLGFVPEFQPLTTWDEAERKRRVLD